VIVGRSYSRSSKRCLSIRSAGLGKFSAGRGSCSVVCDKCNAGLGIYSVGCGMRSAGLGIYSVGCGMRSAGLGIYSVGLGMRSVELGTRSAGIGICSEGCGELDFLQKPMLFASILSIAGEPCMRCSVEGVFLAGNAKRNE
jgi:hypothetical protein